jgi:hypothetical protein
MTTPNDVPGLPAVNVTTSGASWPKPLEKTCGPACIVSPLYVLLNLESPRPMDALKALPNVLREHSGHTTVDLVLDAPSVMEERLFLELHGFWKSGLLQSSFHGLADPALAEAEELEKLKRCDTTIGGMQCYLLRHGEEIPHRSITSGWVAGPIDKVDLHGMGEKRHAPRVVRNQRKRTPKDRGGDSVQTGSDTQQPEQVDPGQRVDRTQALRIPSEEDRLAWGLW